jgi:DNA invertase Pin-like site-specific DNA recombinase
MQRDFPEADWKILSKLKPLALDRLCQRILTTSEDIILGANEGGYHSAYLELYKHIQARDEVLSHCFDDWRRSRALLHLVNWCREKLITDEEFATLSAETRNEVDSFLRRD